MNSNYKPSKCFQTWSDAHFVSFLFYYCFIRKILTPIFMCHWFCILRLETPEESSIDMYLPLLGSTKVIFCLQFECQKFHMHCWQVSKNIFFSATLLYFISVSTSYRHARCTAFFYLLQSPTKHLIGLQKSLLIL